jgi:hypothetical protein
MRGDPVPASRRTRGRNWLLQMRLEREAAVIWPIPLNMSNSLNRKSSYGKSLASRGMSQMWRHRAFFTITLLMASSMGVSVSGAPLQEYERLGFEFEQGWKVGYEAGSPYQGITEFIREGDDINNWKELLTIHNYPPSWGGSSSEDLLNTLKAIRETRCPGVTKWNIIGKDEKSILYEWQAKPCLGWPDQHEIARIISTKYNRFHVRYTVKMYQMSPEERTKWIGKFSRAKIDTILQ